MDIMGGGGLVAMQKTSNAAPKLTINLQLICKQIHKHEDEVLKEKYLHHPPPPLFEENDDLP